ncbi:MAG: hypothetical protein MUF64_26945 [Polyangiaceae bacterium]|nr:hypothetical protein [Polyangiaceae bacterium]
MMSASSASLPRSAAPREAPLSLAELGGAVLAGLAPMPAESAAYLLLGIADHLEKAPIPLDPKAILLSPEGNLSLLTLTTTSRSANADERVLEGQLRGLLGRLLAQAPGQAPALTAVARRPPTGKLRALIHELEGALIPVNRSAGRRALARLQREVDRSRHRIPAPLTLEPAPLPPAPPAPPAAPSRPAPAKAAPALALAPIPSLLPPTICQPEVAPEPTEAQLLPPLLLQEPQAAPAQDPQDLTELRAPVHMEFHYTEKPYAQASLEERSSLQVPPAVEAGRGEVPAVARAFRDEESEGTRAPTVPLPRVGRPATVEELLAGFEPSDGLSEREVSRLLKQAVGVEPTVLPPGVETFGPPVVVDVEPWQPAPEVAPVKTSTPTPYEPRPPRNPRASLLVMFLLLLVGLGLTVGVWVKAPGFFSGHGP